ncbi:hypothetical protein C8J56DRAFT_768344 [Mycena floridula]|nr:hypothetical protein C8J56DRAFT_768344 [Mycena floridula]
MYVPPVADAKLVLDFDRDDMKRCTLSDRDTGEELFRVTSGEKFMSMTISRGDGSILALLERHDIMSDKITVAGRKRVSVRKWLKSPLMSRFPVTFEEEGRTYTWNRGDRGEMTLTSPSAGGANSIAVFQPSKRYLINQVSQQGSAYLALQPEAEEICDIVVASLVVLEQKIRWSRNVNSEAVAITAVGSIAIGSIAVR